MKTFKLNVEWCNGHVDTFTKVTDYRVREGTLHIWFISGHKGAHVIPNSAYKMAWPEEND